MKRIIQSYRQKRDMQTTCPSFNKTKEQLASLNEEIQQYAARYDGKLLLEEEFFLPPALFSLLVEKQILSPIPSIQSTLLSTTCERCHQSEKHYFATIQCARCKKSHLYCRYCIQMGRVMECTPLYEWTGPSMVWPVHEQPCSWEGQLTKTQQYAAHRMVEAMKGNRQLLIWAVTGSGKTEMLFPSITAALQTGRRVCLASPRADVVRELLPRFKQAFSSVPIQGLYGGSRDNDGTAQFIVATTHQLLRFKHAFDMLIIDEVDAFPFHQDDTLQFAAERARKLTSSLIYLTATPRKKQRQQMITKQLDYVFVPVRFHRYLLPVPTFTYCTKLQQTLTSQQLPKAFTHWLQHRNKPSRQLLIFVPTIQLSEHLLSALNKYFLESTQLNHVKNKVTFVHAEDPDREEKVDAFRQRFYDVLVTTTILERGVTFPAIDVAVLWASHEVFDEAALVQISGRAGRSVADPTGEVVFFHDGKTNSMVKAQTDIIRMNQRAKKLMLGDEK